MADETRGHVVCQGPISAVRFEDKVKTTFDKNRDSIAVATAYGGHVFAMRAPRGTGVMTLARAIVGLQDCAAELAGTSIPVSFLPTLFRQVDDPDFKPFLSELGL